MAGEKYVHGYSQKENQRLLDQASTLTELLHRDTSYPGGSLVLEAGCGVGAQTVTLAKNSPGANIISVDISDESLALAEKAAKSAGCTNVTFTKADIFSLPFPEKYFDHVFVCFVLEHLREPGKALLHLKQKLKTGGTITVIEGDHGSAYYYPRSDDAQRTIECLIEIQAEMGGNSLIGRQLFPLLAETDFKNITVSPRVVYADASKPEMVKGFTKNTFNAMVEGVKDRALECGIIDEKTWIKGIADLHRTEKKDGTFSYTFFKAIATK